MEVEVKSFKMLPPAPGKCKVCAVEHGTDDPHDAQSLYYGVQFKGKFGRDGTWADAVAHCPDEIKRYWEQELRRLGYWTEPPAGEEPIDQPVR